MFEHRQGHLAPPGAGTASRLPRGHGSLALSITDATVTAQGAEPGRDVCDCGLQAAGRVSLSIRRLCEHPIHPGEVCGAYH